MTAGREAPSVVFTDALIEHIRHCLESDGWGAPGVEDAGDLANAVASVLTQHAGAPQELRRVDGYLVPGYDTGITDSAFVRTRAYAEKLARGRAMGNSIPHTVVPVTMIYAARTEESTP